MNTKISVAKVLFVICICNSANGSTLPSDLLSQLLSGPLRGDDIFIIDDTEFDTRIDWNEIGNEGSKILYGETSTLDLSLYELENMKGSNLITVWVVDSESYILSSLLVAPVVWNPQYLVILSLNDTIDQEVIFSKEFVSRAQYAVLILYSGGGNDDVFRVRSSHPLNENELIRMQNYNSNYYNSKSRMFPERFKSMSGANMKIASFCDDYPFLYPDEAKGCIGAGIDMLDILSMSINFTYELQLEPIDQKWGAFEDGNWTGMLADLAFRDRDLIINYYLVNHERWIAFDSIYPYKSEGFGFLSTLPKPLPKWNSLLLPFTWEMWMTIIGCTATVSVLLAALSVLYSASYLSESISKAVLSVSSSVRWS